MIPSLSRPWSRSLEEEPYDYEIVSASDGVEAGSEIGRSRPDLLILDIMMPNVDGHEVCRKVKQDPSATHTKVIVLSAFMNERLRENEGSRRRRLLLEAIAVGDAEKRSGTRAGNVKQTGCRISRK